MKKKVHSKPKKTLKKVHVGSELHPLHKKVPHMTSFMVISGTIALLLLAVSVVKSQLGMF
jgi:hypothetical protein